MTIEEQRLLKAKEIINQTREFLINKKKEIPNNDLLENEEEIDDDLKAHFLKENLKRKRDDKKAIFD